MVFTSHKNQPYSSTKTSLRLINQGTKMLQRPTGMISEEGCQARPSHAELLPQTCPRLCTHSAVPALGEGEWGASPGGFWAQCSWPMVQEEQQLAFGKELALENVIWGFKVIKKRWAAKVEEKQNSWVIFYSLSIGTSGPDSDPIKFLTTQCFRFICVLYVSVGSVWRPYPISPNQILWPEF